MGLSKLRNPFLINFAGMYRFSDSGSFDPGEENLPDNQPSVKRTERLLTLF